MLLSSLFDLSAVMWANVSGDVRLGNDTSDLERLTVGHVANNSPTLWVHFCSVVVKTLMVLFLLHHMSIWVAAQQRRVSLERLRSVEGRTVLVTDVPDGVAGARATFTSLYPSSFLSAVAAVEPRPPTKLAAQRDALVSKLEDARFAFDKSKRLTADGVSLGERPTHRTGPLGLWGARVDSIDAHTEQLLDADSRLSAARTAALVGQSTADAPLRSAAFVTFTTPRAAAIAAQVALERDVAFWHLSPAPPASDCFWANTGRLSFAQRGAMVYITGAALAAMVIFFMIPIAAVSALSTLSNLARLLPFLEPILEVPVVRSVLEGVLPGLALLIFMAILPSLVRALASARGVSTCSGLDAAELRGMFWFSGINVFLANCLAGSVFAGLKEVIDKPTSLFDTLGTTVPATSRFFLTFILLKAVGDSAGAVSGIVGAAIYLLRTRLLGGRRTARREAACWAPKSVSLGTAFSDTMLVLLLTVIYSTLAPIVLLAGLLYFALRLIAVKSQLLYTHEPQYEGAAQMWPVARMRVGVALIVYQATVAGVLGLKRSAVPAILLIVAVIPATAAAMHALAVHYDVYVPGRKAAPLTLFGQDGEPASSAADGKADAQETGVGAPSELDGAEQAEETFLPPALQPPSYDIRTLLDERGGHTRSGNEQGSASAQTDEEEPPPHG